MSSGTLSPLLTTVLLTEQPPCSPPSTASYEDNSHRKGSRFRVKKKKRSDVDCAGDNAVGRNRFLSQPELRDLKGKDAKKFMKVDIINVEQAPVAPASSLWTVSAEDAVQLRMETSGRGADPPKTVHTFFADKVRQHPYANAIAFKPDPKKSLYNHLTYIEYYRLCVQAAKSLIKLGLEPYHAVAILGFNCLEWFVSDMAAIFAGGLACGIYTTNSAETCQFIASNSNAQVIMSENAEQTKKFLSVLKDLPKVKAIVQWQGELPEKNPKLMTWKDFMELSKNDSDEVLAARLKPQAPNRCCTLIYTSGTTGNPKGVMLSHDNLTWTAKATVNFVGLRLGQEVLVSYLPLSHVAAQVVDIFGAIEACIEVYFAQPDALKGSLGETLREARPTIFLGVPRVWEKMMEKMLAFGRTLSPTKKKLGRWAKGIGLRGSLALMNGESVPWGWTLAHLLVFNRLKKTLGLDRCRICATAAAPITKETLTYFMSVTLPVVEVYGMSESSGPHTISSPERFRITAVGVTPEGFRTKLMNPDADGNGEVSMNSRNVFMGYLNNMQNTSDSIDPDGWLRSGDIGKEDSDGFLYITGRIKEILITAGGENVAPVPIEDRVKVSLPVLSNCMLLGDKRKFLSILLTVRCQVDDEGAPKDELTEEALEWLREHDAAGPDTVTKFCEAAKDPKSKIAKAIDAGIAQANEAAVSRATKIQKWVLLREDFSVSGGELGPTMKLRRPIVCKKYASVIDELYKE